MSNEVQILIGLLPAVLLLFGYIVLERKHVVPVLASLLFMCSLGGLCWWTAQSILGDTAAETRKVWKLDDDEEEVIVDAADQYALIDSLIAEGVYEEAEILLKDVIEQWGYQPQAALAQARIYEKQGDTAASSALYQKAKAAGIIDGEDEEDYGEEFLDAAEAMKEIDRIYTSYLNSDSSELESLVDYEEQLSDLMEDNPVLADTGVIRNAAIKAAVLNGNYGDIVGRLDRSSPVSEIMIASQLYIDGYVEDDDFTENYVERDKTQIDAVRKQLQKIVKNSEGNIKEKAEELEARYDGYRKGGAIYQLEQDLLEAAGKQQEESSKAYLQMAKIELSKGDNEQAEQYVSQAFKTVDTSTDDDYTFPMYQIISLIGDKNDAEGLKQLALYTENVLDNQLDIALSKDTEEFQQFVSDAAIQSRVSVSIMNIDASAFDTVKADFQFDGDFVGDIRNHIVVEDCGVEITDYQIEKITYDSAKMLLCCDVSGSMDGKPIADLREAVKAMSASELGNVEIAIVAFSNDANMILDFTNDNVKVTEAADQLISGGGTRVHNAVMHSLDCFDGSRGNSMEYVVVLSDGASSDSAPLETVAEEIRRKAEERGIIVHSLGLGDGVDANYLETIARATGGTYAYVSNSETLNTFYKGLQTRKDYSYRITYKAKDTLAQNRLLKISAKDEEYRYDEKAYYLGGAEAGDGGADLVFAQGRLINGLDTRFILRSGQDTVVHLTGSGFTAEDTLTVELSGGRSYKLSAEYVDSGSYALIIPAETACGTYDLDIRLNGKQTVLENELTVVSAENQRLIEFGPYRFTAYQKVQGEDYIYMDGFVTLNDWLHFKGGVYLYGNPYGDSLVLAENSGSYIEYQNSSVIGLTEYLAENNQVTDLPALGEITICQDTTRNNSGKMEEVSLGGSIILTEPEYVLYPDALTLKFDHFCTELPGQDTIFGAGADQIFEFAVQDTEAVLTKNTVEIDMETIANEYERNYYAHQMGQWDVSIRPSGIVSMNTLENEYAFNFGIKLNFFDGEEISLKTKWHGTDQLVPYDFSIYSLAGFTKTVSGVPVTFYNFSLSAEEMKSDDLMSTVWSGQCTASVEGLETVSPDLYEYISDTFSDKIKEVSLDGTYTYLEDVPRAASLNDITITGCLNEDVLQMTGNLVLLENLDCGELTFAVGDANYTNQLLNMSGVSADGLYVRSEVNPQWISDKVVMNMNLTADVMATDKIFGISGEGDCELEISLWEPEVWKTSQGKVFVGFYTDHDGQSVFTIRGRDISGQAEKAAFDISKPIGE